MKGLDGYRWWLPWLHVSIPSRGFWFFEVDVVEVVAAQAVREFQSPRGDFGFLKSILPTHAGAAHAMWFQSPRGDFGFLKWGDTTDGRDGIGWGVSIPSRGFWFFEVNQGRSCSET